MHYASYTPKIRQMDQRLTRLSLPTSTGVQWNTLSPTWNAKWELLNVPEDAILEIFIKDKDKIKEDTPLGETRLTLGSRLEGTQEHTLDLARGDGKPQGQVFIQVPTRSVSQMIVLDRGH
jgi:Ca2+-dependent lipid-binding protein